MKPQDECLLSHQLMMEHEYEPEPLHMHSVQTESVDEHGHQEIHTTYHHQTNQRLLRSELR